MTEQRVLRATNDRKLGRPIIAHVTKRHVTYVVNMRINEIRTASFICFKESSFIVKRI